MNQDPQKEPNSFPNQGNLPQKIKFARKARGLTQAGLAQKLQLGQSDLSKLENGQFKDPGFEFVCRIAEVLGVSVQSLAQDNLDMLISELTQDALAPEHAGTSAADVEHAEHWHKQKVQAWKYIRVRLDDSVQHYLQTGDANPLAEICTKEVSDNLIKKLDYVRSLGLKYTSNKESLLNMEVDVVYPEPGDENQDFVIEEKTTDGFSQFILEDPTQGLRVSIRTGGLAMYKIESISPAHQLYKTMKDIQGEVKKYLMDEGPVFQAPYDQINAALPGGGFKTKQLAMVLGKSGTGKVLLGLDVARNMAHQGIDVMFFSLEQPRAQIYVRLVMMELGIDRESAIKLLDDDDPILKPVGDVFKHITIIDNVPYDHAFGVDPMNPVRIGQIIGAAPTKPKVVIIDHLGIVQIDNHAPQSVQKNHIKAAGYIMQELLMVAKVHNVYMQVLQNLPKEVPEGVEFSYDAGRGTSQQTDYCDYIFAIWRPEREHNISDEDRLQRSGQYKLKLSKNRHGPSATAHLAFDASTGCITPELKFEMKFDDVDEPESGQG